MIARIARDLVAYRRPGLSIDQHRMLAWVELVFVRNLTGVNRVREHRVDVSAGERFAATLGAICPSGALAVQPEVVGLVLDPAHATELTIERKDATHRLGLGGVDNERPLPRLI